MNKTRQTQLNKTNSLQILQLRQAVELSMLEPRYFSLNMVISVALEYKKHNFMVKPVTKHEYD